METWFEIFFNWIWDIIYGIMRMHDPPALVVEKKNTQPYEYKYLDAFDASVKHVIDSHSEANYSNNFVMDYTPYGNVIMNYDKEEEMFIYYCDKREIPFKYLETVARKFVIHNKCHSIYVDIRDELRPKKMDVEIVDLKEGEQEDGVKNEKIKSVFATFKKKTGKKSVKNETSRKKVVFKENVNKYKWSGRLNEYSILEPNHLQYARSKKISTEVEEISFADFKNLPSK